MSPTLETQAHNFAEELNETLALTLPNPGTVTADKDGDRFVVARHSGDGRIIDIPLQASGAPVGGLKVRYSLELDHTGTWLKVTKSTVAVRSIDRVPVLRVEFDESSSTRPSAHWHVHSESARMAHMMTLGQVARKASTKNPIDFSSVHLPNGGTRFRPCIEDVLQVLIMEFGVDRLDRTWREALDEGRTKWRRRQLASAIRDDPIGSAATLKNLGWEIQAPRNPSAASTTLLRY